jgi:2-polyprenyl-6-methoxyphenol hydroxylase-like FAD-dependent oxidoreductase
MDTSKTIAVLGAGIAGLAFATLAHRAGHAVTVFDQFDRPAPVGSGLMLQTTGLAVLNTLGLAQKTLLLTSPIKRLHGETAGSGRTVLDVRFTALRKSLGAEGIQRGTLFDLLLEAAKSRGIDLQTGSNVTACDETAGTILLADGTIYGPYDLVVDALGVNSPLVPAPGKTLPYGALWATIPWPKGAPFAIDALEQRYQGAHKMAGVMPSGQASGGGPVSATYFWSIRNDAEADWRASGLDTWKREALALWPETECLLDGVTTHNQLTFARYRHRTTRRISQDKLVHIGDSWHAASPQLGQGANMALLDAYALNLALEQSGGDVPKALRRFVQFRATHVRLYQTMSFLFTPVYQSDSHILPWLRDGLAATLSRIPPAPQFLAAMVSGALLSPLKKLGLRPLDV